MAYDGREIANFILDHCERIGKPVSNLSLQKLVYFCHVWMLVDHGRPLVRHKFEAWEHGPVLQYLYHEFKTFGDQAITGRATKLDRSTGQRVVADYDFPVEAEKLLSWVVTHYSKYTASQLRNLSHVEGGPWATVWNHGGSVNPGMKLSDQNIAEFYSREEPPFTKQ